MKILTTELRSMLSAHPKNASTLRLRNQGKTLTLASTLKQGGWLETDGQLTAAGAPFRAFLNDTTRLSVLLKHVVEPFVTLERGSELRLLADAHELARLPLAETVVQEPIETVLAHLEGACLAAAAKRVKNLNAGVNTFVTFRFDGERVTLLGTDGFRILCEHLPCRSKPHEFLPSYETLHDLSKLGRGRVTVSYREHALSFSQGGRHLRLGSCDKPFPRYEAVLDFASFGQVTFPTAPVAAFLSEAAKLNATHNRRVDVFVRNSAMTLTAHDQPLETSLDVTGATDFALAFDARRLLSGLPTSASARLTVTGRDTQAALTGDGDGFAVVMPLLKTDFPNFKGSGQTLNDFLGIPLPAAKKAA